MTDLAADLLRFIDASPTPYHAVAQAVRRLEGAGYSALGEADLWELAPGDRRHAVRGDASLVAFQVGALPPASGGFRIVGAHTDSPNLRVKPRPDRETSGYRQLAVEPYGALLVHTWLDRDLSLAGRVTLAGDGAHQTVLVDFERPLLRIPNLAIHLQREIAEQGLKLNAQQHLPPLVGLGELPPLRELVAAELRARLGRPVRAEQVLGFDLMAYDVQPAARAGARGEFLLAPRLDNLASCHAALSALLAVSGGAPAAATRMIVLYDHEEVGSRSAQGAAGTFLQEALERVVTGVKGGELQGLARAVRRSNLVSADMAHALHPNYADRHDPEHRPLLGGGPVIKVNANQSYASDAATAGLFTGLCARVGVAPQHIVTRSDLACGSTIGPITAARVGVPTVDVGSPMLSMHSCREMAGADDVKPMIDVLAAFLAG